MDNDLFIDRQMKASMLREVVREHDDKRFAHACWRYAVYFMLPGWRIMKDEVSSTVRPDRATL